MKKRNNEKESLPWHFKLNIKYLLKIHHFNGFDTIFYKKILKTDKIPMTQSPNSRKISILAGFEFTYLYT